MKLKADAGVNISFSIKERACLSGDPASTAKVLTIDSLEVMPTRRADIARRSPKPKGAKIGSNARPIYASRLLSISGV